MANKKLSNIKCTPCRIGSPKVSDEKINEYLLEIPNWKIKVDEKIKKIYREFKFSNFIDGVEFTNQVANIAEEEGHHPEIIIKWGVVIVFFWTHKINGLHKNDFVMAAKIDNLFD